MPLDRLDNLVAIGKLKAEAPAQTELDGLCRSGSERLKDSQRKALSLSSRFDLVYNAGHYSTTHIAIATARNTKATSISTSAMSTTSFVS
jgi:hypothetical protein